MVIRNGFNWLRIVKETRRRSMKNYGFEVRSGRRGGARVVGESPRECIKWDGN